MRIHIPVAFTALILGFVIHASVLSVCAAPVLSIAPSPSMVQVGQDFSLDVLISGVTDLSTFQFNLAYDPKILSATALTEGAFLPTGGTTFFDPGIMDDTKGTIAFTIDTLIGPIAGVSGDGVLARVDFQAVALGVSPVSLSNVLLLDSTITEIGANTSDGRVTVTPPLGPTPKPLTVTCIANCPPVGGFNYSGALPLDPPASAFSTANGINNAGQIVGDFSMRATDDGRVSGGFLYTNGSFSTINVLDLASANSINSIGEVVGDIFNGNGSHSFLYSGGNVSVFNVPGSFDGSFENAANGINDTGQIVGYFNNAAARKNDGYLYSEGKFTTIAVPGSTSTVATGINNAGQIVGYFFNSTNQAHGFLYSDGQFTTIDVPGGFNTTLSCINNAGQIVGNFLDDPIFGKLHGFLYSGVSFSTIDVDGSAFTDVNCINDAGQIVGNFGETMNFDDVVHGFLATPQPAPSPGPGTTVPEPSTLTLFGAGLVSLLGYSWFRRHLV